MRVNAIQQNIYVQRVNHVLDYITTHLDDELPLKQLAAVAGFSDYHFHRIFKAIVGETLNQFVWRVRIERGAALLRSDPNMKVSDVAVDCGFTSLAGFSRAFKAHFGVAPTQWNRLSRLRNEPEWSRDQRPTYHITTLHALPEKFPVHFRHMPAQRLAYIRVHDSYRDMQRIEDAYHRLFRWYEAQGGSLADTTLYGMSQDDPDITPQELCRFDWCLRVPDTWHGDGEVNIRDFPSCLLAAIEMNGTGLDVEERLWQYFWRDWLPRSHYQPANLPAMEIYRRFPHEAGWWDTLYMTCALPVTRL